MIIALILYIVALFFLGIGNAVITYHILRYRDPDDISGIVLVVYYILTVIVLLGTAFLIDWNQIFS
jgi:hypothetical protein